MSRGGMTAREFIRVFADKQGFFRRKFASQAYLIALGANDIAQKHPVGTLNDLNASDWRRNEDTFAGNMGGIISAFREIEPRSAFFLITMPKGNGIEYTRMMKDRHRELMYELAAHYPNTYVIDLREYGLVYDDTFRKLFYLNGHMNAAGYLFTAQVIASYMDYIVRHNMEAFAETGLV